MANAETQAMPTFFGFLLLDDFTLISMSSAIETLRMANRVAGSRVYRWRMVSRNGGPVTASDGLSINADFGIGDEIQSRTVDAIIVCGGEGVERFAAKPVLRWLHACSARGLGLGSTCTGSYVLAKAGLLDGYRCSIHWENFAALTLGFPKIAVSRSIYTIDRDRFTSSGGTAPMDMMLYFVRRQLGTDISAGVADQFVHERIRDTRDRQHVPLRHVVGGQSAKLVSAVELMESNIREPFSQVELA
ncbi:MAG: GlxA family transcriptional regulator, partial [Rhodospirillaceae bacterium]|nr:GlxA family transcriptional regulator [Rhodospirillaceae bacterium]